MVVVQHPSELEPSLKKNARWSQEDNAVIIDLLKCHQSKGNQSDNGWKGLVWTACEVALRDSEKESGGGPKTANGCKEHWLSMRRSYLTVKNLMNQSGWGWDDERKLVVAPPDVWDTYIMAHPAAKKWRSTPFVHYNEFHALVDGRHATGGRAYRVSLASDNDLDDATLAEDLEAAGDNINTSQSTNASSQVNVTDVVSSQGSHLKRAASSSPSPLPSSKRPRSSQRGPAVVQDVAKAIREFSASMLTTTTIANTPSTPKRRQAAIEVVEQDETFTTPEQMKVWNLFYKDIAAADSYMAITDERKRNLFVRGLLDMPADDPDNPFL